MISKRTHIFTSESVTEGHPDKMADQISDCILDAYLEQDSNSRVAIECLLKTGICFIAGETKSKALVDIPKLARQQIEEIGYNSTDLGFDAQTCGVMVAIEDQSEDIALGVDEREDKFLGAGDQGLMFGYACDETSSFMPLPISYAHALAKKLSIVRKQKLLPFLGPDGKTQVSVVYENEEAVKVNKIVVSTQHHPYITQEQIKEAVIEEVIKKVISKDHLKMDCEIMINPTGNFVIGGPKGDTGLTGRKIIVDTYGGMARHGGGAFSGKDPSKVDRSAAYMARYIAKNIVAARIAKRCEIQIAYAIGISEPVSLLVNTFNTSSIDESIIENMVKKTIDLRPHAIIQKLNLKKPIYKNTAAYGHFGRIEEDFTWERLDLVETFTDYLG